MDESDTVAQTVDEVAQARTALRILEIHAAHMKRVTAARTQLAREVHPRTLAIALLGTSDDIRAAISANMSRRAAQMLEEDLESLERTGELTTRDVQEARSAIGAALYQRYAAGGLQGEERG